ncbi:hypothetical protein L345_07240, partial [Ophiophagus hannah]
MKLANDNCRIVGCRQGPRMQGISGKVDFFPNLCDFECSLNKAVGQGGTTCPAKYWMRSSVCLIDRVGSRGLIVEWKPADLYLILPSFLPLSLSLPREGRTGREEGREGGEEKEGREKKGGRERRMREGGRKGWEEGMEGEEGRRKGG